MRSETRRAVRRSLAELSERPLRGRLPVLRWCPLRASLLLDLKYEGTFFTLALLYFDTKKQTDAIRDHHLGGLDKPR